MTLVFTLITKARRFLHQEEGAVTIDWVVLTAAVIGMTLIVTTTINQALYEQAANVIAAKVENSATR
jgi:hypothetical protein